MRPLRLLAYTIAFYAVVFTGVVVVAPHVDAAEPPVRYVAVTEIKLATLISGYCMQSLLMAAQEDVTLNSFKAQNKFHQECVSAMNHIMDADQLDYV